MIYEKENRNMKNPRKSIFSVKICEKNLRKKIFLRKIFEMCNFFEQEIYKY